ncbi:hypothetical protein EIMP300_83380 [Escherichia coli]|uniref:Metalloenzyme domain-containing protein n=1 Tax=Escherichia coli TaxID=562 RepID=A0A8S0G5B2_ECOLX|nr:hypothetical protein EIMP300_83380 [Escherichia coli]
MKRAFIMVLDSFGIGATEDAERFGDVGADTLGHIAEACAKGEADHGRKGPLNQGAKSDPSWAGESTRRFYRFHSGGNGWQR